MKRILATFGLLCPLGPLPAADAPPPPLVTIELGNRQAAGTPSRIPCRPGRTRVTTPTETLR